MDEERLSYQPDLFDRVTLGVDGLEAGVRQRVNEVDLYVIDFFVPRTPLIKSRVGWFAVV